MKNLIILFLIINCDYIFSQVIDLKNINSNNILEIIEKNSPINTKSNSITSVSQIGNANYAEIINKSGKGYIQMSQIGDFNTSYFINPYKNQKPETSVNVKGSNNHVDITGVNSISDKIIINLNTNDKMIFIRNY